jgi:hypothetical protein
MMTVDVVLVDIAPTHHIANIFAKKLCKYILGLGVSVCQSKTSITLAYCVNVS